MTTSLLAIDGGRHGHPGTESRDEDEIRGAVADLLGAGYARVATTGELLGDDR